MSDDPRIEAALDSVAERYYNGMTDFVPFELIETVLAAADDVDPCRARLAAAETELEQLDDRLVSAIYVIETAKFLLHNLERGDWVSDEMRLQQQMFDRRELRDALDAYRKENPDGE